jgi:pimeloyl-ACP methyl ester carboxylesterase
MPEFTLQYKSSRIGYCRYGEGPETLLCFHGYGETASGFEFLAKYAGSQYTIYAIDLPFHGRTEWNEGLRFDITDLVEIVSSVLQTGQQSQGSKEIKFSVLGFSLGGRVALSLYGAKPGWVTKIILLAPDGLKLNFWYWLSTQTRMGNRFFAFTMKKPHWFFGLLKLLNRMKLINASIFKFVNYYIGNEEVRRLLYERWTGLRKLKPDLHFIKSLIRERDTPVSLVYGKHDRIILSSVGEKFRKDIPEQCTITIIPSGHQVLHEKHAKEIMQSIRG